MDALYDGDDSESDVSDSEAEDSDDEDGDIPQVVISDFREMAGKLDSMLQYMMAQV
ncbi:hypothetical protein HDU98_005162, partial [Podochytrium sp. JEL0797]